MDNKKTKLTLSGIAKKSIENIELAKTQSKNSVVIEKKLNKFAPRANSGRTTSVRSKPTFSSPGGLTPRTSSVTKPSKSSDAGSIEVKSSTISDPYSSFSDARYSLRLEKPF